MARKNRYIHIDSILFVPCDHTPQPGSRFVLCRTHDLCQCLPGWYVMQVFFYSNQTPIAFDDGPLILKRIETPSLNQILTLFSVPLSTRDIGVASRARTVSQSTVAKNRTASSNSGSLLQKSQPTMTGA